MEKHPLTLQLQSFAVWHRLLQDSLASPRGPFMVELFTAGGFAAGLRAGLAPGFNCHQLKAPHASQVERSQRLRAPWTGLRATFQLHITRFEHCGLQSKPDCRYVRVAPIFHTGGRSDRLVQTWSTSLRSVDGRPKEFSHRIECRDYSVCNATAIQEQLASQVQDYSDKPPSNWTSQSPGIQLYGPIT